MQLLHSEHASRKVNGQAVIQAIVAANAPVSRAELARELGLSKQTLSEITSLLEQSQWIQPVGRKQGALGRAAVSYELNPNACYVVGAILEGEQYTIGLADMRGNLRSKKEGKLTPKAQSDSAALSDCLVNLVHGLVEDAGISGDLVRHMVIGCPGVVDQVSMHVHHSPNLPSLQGLDLRNILSHKFNCAVQLDNDLNLHAYGEYRYGCSQKTLSSVFIGLGSGIGMGIMLDKQIWRGARGGAGEIGYMPVDRQPQSAEARRRGALECSLSAIDGPQAADALARDCAFALACIVPILDPEIVVIGGTKGDDPELHARLGGWLDKFSVEKINVRRSALGADAGLRGAIAMGVQACQDQLFLV